MFYLFKRFTLTVLSMWLAAACTVQPIASSPRPSVTPSPPPSVVPSATPSAGSQPTDLWIGPGDVQVHPDGVLYSGDQISFRITAHNASQVWLARVPVRVQTGSPDQIIESDIGSIDIGASNKTDLYWVWDTTGLHGSLPITVTLDPAYSLTSGDADRSNDVVQLSVDLKPAEAQPPIERAAHWGTATSQCCRYHYITGTAAERDIDLIKQTADAAWAYVAAQYDRPSRRPVDVYLIDRVLGQGGLADSAVIVSYLDRDYSGGEFSQVLRHEFTHILDQARVHRRMPLFLLEGSAVYVSGGHYQPEPIARRAAALLEGGAYIPLRELIDHFFTSQHETAYAESAAFIQYLVERFGRDTYNRFFTGLHYTAEDTDSAVIDRGAHEWFDVGLDALERDWQTWLRRQPVTAADRAGILNSIAFYEAVRHYERLLDPSAYLQNLWVPDIRSSEMRGLVADYQRHPDGSENIALETMLAAADRTVLAGDFATSQTLLDSVNHVLDSNLSFDDPLAAQYLAVVEAARTDGYDPQRVMIAGRIADVWATRGDAQLIRLSARLDGDQWLV